MSILHKARRILCQVLIVAIWGLSTQGSTLYAQRESVGGIKRFTENQWTIVTDLPIDQEIQSWPNLLDQALSAWCQEWAIDPGLAKTWPLTVHCIADRKLFEQAGLLEGTPPFDDGFQQADRVFFMDQPSGYYRRHLLLHEATHWVMYRAFSGGGSPWYMEGIAEVQGTHRFENGKLTMAVIPSDPVIVPHWGRFKRISDSIATKGVPSLKQILHYGNDRQDRMDRYSWSWAACVFLTNHQVYGPYLQKVAAAPLDYSNKLSESLLDALADRWDWVERDWKLFVDEFGFGFQPNKNIREIEQQAKAATNLTGNLQMEVDPKNGWQLAEVFVKAGQKINIQADGFCLLRVQNGQAWEASPSGLSYQYHRHFPIGKLIGGFISTDTTLPLDVFGIGKQAAYVAPSDGWILFAVNEPIGERHDNSGKFRLGLSISEASNPSQRDR